MEQLFSPVTPRHIRDVRPAAGEHLPQDPFHLLARGCFPSTPSSFLLQFRLYHLKQFGIVSYKRAIQILTVEDDRIARCTELDRAIEIRFVGIAALAPLFQIDPLGLYRKLGSPAAQFT